MESWNGIVLTLAKRCVSRVLQSIAVNITSWTKYQIFKSKITQTHRSSESWTSERNRLCAASSISDQVSFEYLVMKAAKQSTISFA